MEEESKSFVQDAIDEVLGQLRANESVIMPDSFQGIVFGFVDAINWTERWIQALLGFHVLVLLLVVLTRDSLGAQAFLCVFLVGTVLLAEPLNGVLKSNWKLFATQDYFDDRGIFITIMLSFPFILILIVQITLMLCNASSLLVKVKVQQIKRELKEKKKLQESEAPKKSSIRKRHKRE